MVLLMVMSCEDPAVIAPPVETTRTDLFNTKGAVVINAQYLTFNLPTTGFCTLTIIDSVANQVVTRENINGKTGENKIKLYTTILPKGNLILVLKDSNKGQLGRTLIINK